MSFIQLGPYLRELRMKRELTEVQVAEALETHQVCISKLENGERYPVKGELLVKLAKFYRVNHAELRFRATLTAFQKGKRDKDNNGNKITLSMAKMVNECVK